MFLLQTYRLVCRVDLDSQHAALAAKRSGCQNFTTIKLLQLRTLSLFNGLQKTVLLSSSRFALATQRVWETCGGSALNNIFALTNGKHAFSVFTVLLLFFWRGSKYPLQVKL